MRMRHKETIVNVDEKASLHGKIDNTKTSQEKIKTKEQGRCRYLRIEVP